MSKTVVPFPRRGAAAEPAGEASAAGPRCPICGKREVQAFRPFCSKRCAQIDLSRWFNERYAIPAEEAASDSLDPDLDTQREEPS